MVNYGSEAVLGPPPHNDFQLKDSSAKKIGGSMKSRTGVCCSLLYTHAQNCPNNDYHCNEQEADPPNE